MIEVEKAKARTFVIVHDRLTSKILRKKLPSKQLNNLDHLKDNITNHFGFGTLKATNKKT